MTGGYGRVKEAMVEIEESNLSEETKKLCLLLMDVAINPINS